LANEGNAQNRGCRDHQTFHLHEFSHSVCSILSRPCYLPDGLLRHSIFHGLEQMLFQAIARA
jgi:hypothetical protein